MAGLSIKCPNCDGIMNIRSSNRLTPTTLTARVFCTKCQDVKADFIGEVTNIKRANWQDDVELKNRTFDKNKPVYSEK